MLLKWIACHPELGRYDAFIAEQRVWNRETFQRERVNTYVMAGGRRKSSCLSSGLIRQRWTASWRGPTKH